MLQEKNMWWKLGILLLSLVMVMSLMVACGDDDDDDEEVTPPTATVSPTETETATPTETVSDGPVKIGALGPWSGGLAIVGVGIYDPILSMVEDQVNNTGGILGGRPIEFVKYDDEGIVSASNAGYTRLSTMDKVSAILFGGATGATTSLAADLAQEYEVPLFTTSTIPPDLTDKPYVVRSAQPKLESQMKLGADLVLNTLKPTTVGYLADDDDDMRNSVRILKDLLGSNVETVYEEYVIPGTSDLSPYLTKLKRENPDVVMTRLAGPGVNTNVYKQIRDLGGWGDIKLVGLSGGSSDPDIIGEEGAQGTYHWFFWTPAVTGAGSEKFKQDYEAKTGRTPGTTQAIVYTAVHLAVQAIDLAGSDDPEEIARFARSGQLQVETPLGPMKITPDGENDLMGFMGQVIDGELVPVQ